ncbi:MAG: phosphoglucosamine mutase [Flavobacteriales bacterium]|nr:phosphoglucosamine mutase [Flavobacteriales bacterium]|tara:strand:+ start:148 stop:1527 length:1380 start_codon:yes stop_codon:yes gene_type:complete
MVLIKSISGIRGTIGGAIGESLSPLDIVRFITAYTILIRKKCDYSNTIVIGRDARVSGEMVSNIVSGTLISCGFDVLDVGLSTTPTIEVAVQLEKLAGGIIITASHNPKQWNALKLLNGEGEFLSKEDGEEVISLSENNDLTFSEVDNLGKYTYDDSFNSKHIEEVLNLDLVDIDLVKKSGFKVVLDAVNSTGGIIIPTLLEKMGVECIRLYCEPNGYFPHNPEPLPEHLTEISKLVVEVEADFGIVVDPDVDRLAIISEDGSMFGEEYTLVAIADYVLSKKSGNTVSNLSSTRALKDITLGYGCKYQASAVGEVNVVEKMKEINAIIGGEGNGGIIYPQLHYGRDALVGIALFLTQLAERKISAKTLRNSFPSYFMSKNKIQLTNDVDIDSIFSQIESIYDKYKITLIDGLKIDFANGWIHLRKSNTEPVIRVYAESTSANQANEFANNMINKIKSLV